MDTPTPMWAGNSKPLVLLCDSTTMVGAWNWLLCILPTVPCMHLIQSACGSYYDVCKHLVTGRGVSRPLTSCPGAPSHRYCWCHSWIRLYGCMSWGFGLPLSMPVLICITSITQLCRLLLTLQMCYCTVDLRLLEWRRLFTSANSA